MLGPCLFDINPSFRVKTENNSRTSTIVPGSEKIKRGLEHHYLHIVRKVLLLFGPFGIKCYESVLENESFPSFERFLTILDEAQLKFLILQLYPFFYHKKILFVGSPSNYLQYVFPHTNLNEKSSDI